MTTNGRTGAAAVVIAILLAAAAPPAAAAEAPPAEGPGWSSLGGRGVGEGRHALAVELGFPGASLTYLRGVNPTVDLAVMAAGNYAYEGVLSTLVPGGHAEICLRFKLMEAGPLTLGLRGGAGFFGYFPLATFVPGLTLPVGVTASLPVNGSLAAAFGVDVPMWITFGTAGGFTAPVLVNAGVEYFLDKAWSATFRARLGPAFNPTGFRFGTPSALTLNLYAGMAFRL
ncbi:MAG TPA: hypothetical protein VND93_29780 [Myxococcales bacterium]|jgi:hypothetical protein|nr:hypothetical protein [Myxococcales bacterium]